MAGQHTPGPWAVHPLAAYIITAAQLDRPLGGSTDKAHDLAHYAQEICALRWPDPHRLEAEVRANAALVAAAPDLLDFVKRFVALTAGISDDGLSADGIARRNTARALIAKAEGR